MKINNLLENITPTSNPDQGQGGQAPRFGRSDKVLEDDKIEETTAGAIASVASPVGNVQRRGKGSMLQGIKTSAKFPNSKQVKEADEWEEDTEKRERFLQYAKQKLLAAVGKGNLSEIALALSVQDNKYFGTPFIDYDIHNRQQGFGSVTVGYVEPKYTAAIANIVDWIKSSQGQAQVAAQQAAIWLQPHGKEFLERVHSDLLSMQDNTREARQKHAIALSGYQVEHLGGKVRGSFKGDSPSDPRDMMTQEVYDIFEITELEIARIHNKRLYDEDLAERKKIWDSIPGPIKQTLAAEHNMNPQQMEAMLFGETEADKVAGYYNNQQQAQPEREEELAEGNPFLQQHGHGGKFPEPRKPRPDGMMSKSEVLGKDGLVYHWQDPRGRQDVGQVETTAQSGVNGNAKCKVCGTAYSKHFRFDDQGKPVSSLLRHPTMISRDFPDLNTPVEEAKKANTKTARAEFGKRPRKDTLSDKEKEQKKSDSDKLWDMLQAHIAQAEKEKGVDEGQRWPDSSNSLAKRSAVATNLKGAPDKAGRTSGMTVATRVDPTITSTKVQRKDDRPIPSFLKKQEQVNEVDPRNFDSDVDYYAARNAPVRQRSSISHRPRDTDSYGNSWSEEEAFRANQRRYAAAKKKAEQEADHDRLATGTNEEQVNEKSKSQAQFRTMAAVAHNPEFAKKVGISPKVGKEFHSADRKQNYKDLPKEVDEEKQRLDPKCWSGYKKQGTKMKGGVRVNNCVPIEEAELTETDMLAKELFKQLELFKKGANKDIGSKAKDKGISKKPKDKDIIAKEANGEYDDEAGSAESNLHTTARAVKGLIDTIDDRDNLPEWVQEKIAKAEQMLVTSWDYLQSQKEQGIDPELDEDWQKTNKQDKTDGMSPKAVKAYRRENPGSKLKTAVTKKPSELKAGSKDAKRRKSFCARMSGMKGPMKDEKGRPTAKAKALNRWNC